jgi:hypothetical protein
MSLKRDSGKGKGNTSGGGALFANQGSLGGPLEYVGQPSCVETRGPLSTALVHGGCGACFVDKAPEPTDRFADRLCEQDTFRGRVT